MVRYIIEIYLDYQANPVLRAMSEEVYSEFKSQFKDLELPDSQADLRDYGTYTMFGFEEDFWNLVSVGLTPTAKRIRGMPADNIPNAAKVPGHESAQTLIVNVSVPNAALFAVQSITWIEDACTMYVQKLMDDGWRIVAVVPANDCRRPTYIMGHFEKNKVA